MDNDAEAGKGDWCHAKGLYLYSVGLRVPEGFEQGITVARTGPWLEKGGHR